jgi:hypothetical protein
MTTLWQDSGIRVNIQVMILCPQKKNMYVDFFVNIFTLNICDGDKKCLLWSTNRKYIILKVLCYKGLDTETRGQQTRLDRFRLEDSSRGPSKGDSRQGQVKRTPAEGRAKETPNRVKWRRLQQRDEQRRLQRGSSEEDSSRGPSKGDSRQGQVKRTPVEGRAKKTPENQMIKIPIDGRIKKTDPSSRQGRRPMTSTP